MFRILCFEAGPAATGAEGAPAEEGGDPAIYIYIYIYIHTYIHT